jgi:hypothetical protein
MAKSRFGITMLVLMEAGRASFAVASMPVNGMYPGWRAYPSAPPSYSTWNANGTLNASPPAGFANPPAGRPWQNPLPAATFIRPAPAPLPLSPGQTNNTNNIYTPVHPMPAIPPPVATPVTPGAAPNASAWNAATITKIAVGAGLLVACGVAAHKFVWPKKVPSLKPSVPSLKPAPPKPTTPLTQPLTPPEKPASSQKPSLASQFSDWLKGGQKPFTPPPSGQTPPPLPKKTSPFQLSPPPKGPVPKPTPPKTKKVSFGPLPLPDVVPVRTLFGPRIAGTNFCQHGPLNNCYMLSAMDGILRHPRAESILEQIPIRREGADYLVHFPSQRAPIRVTLADLAGRGARLRESTYPGLSILEQAYLKLPGATPGRFDGFSEAMTRMFGLRADVVQLQYNGRNAWRPGQAQRLQVVGPVDFTPAERREVFEGILTQLRNETNHESANIYAAILREGASSRVGGHHLVGAHYYAIRIPESSATEVVLGDPLDTRRTFRLSMTDFLENFDIEGVRLPLH